MSAAEKYDRQLRLWGDEGQARLEKSHVCLINGGAVGTESLKNLVLPGIAAFTIVDGSKVEASDLGNNFFLEPSSLGKSRAVSTTELLRELNDRVKGFSVEEDPVSLIHHNVDFFQDFSLVIATQLPEASLRKLAHFLYEKSIPLLVPRVYGFIGYLRIVTPEHTVIESKPDTPPDDLRILTPFPELHKYAESHTLETLDDHHHAHFPYVLILIKILNQWRETHGGKTPSTRPEKEEFKLLIKNASRNFDEEVNFLEAHKAALKAIIPTSIPSDVQDIINDEKASAKGINDKSSEFWILAAALREFVSQEGGGHLPVSGQLPDMTSTTYGFLELQRIYYERSQLDLQLISQHVDNILSRLGRSVSVSAETTKKFVKNARFLKVVRNRSLDLEYTTPQTGNISNEFLMSGPSSNLIYYILLRAVDRFYQSHARFPGCFDGSAEVDIPIFKNFVQTQIVELGLGANVLGETITDEVIEEIARYGASELHSLAALIGGITAQEAIKLITHQYVPLNNTLIFNGNNSTSSTFDL